MGTSQLIETKYIAGEDPRREQIAASKNWLRLVVDFKYGAHELASLSYGDVKISGAIRQSAGMWNGKVIWPFQHGMNDEAL